MNVFKFSIFIKSTKSTSDIKESVLNCYKEKSKHTNNYKDFVERKWKEIDKEQIRSMYSEKAIISYNDISNTKYYIVGITEHDSIDQVTYEVIVISSLEDISKALNIAYDDIKDKLSGFKLTLVDSKALLFIYDGTDIISNSIMIKSNVFSYSKFLMREIIRIIVLGLVFIIALLICILSNNDTLISVSSSVMASCFFFLVSEILLKMNFKKTIEVKVFSKWVEKCDPLINALDINEESTSFHNPSV